MKRKSAITTLLKAGLPMFLTVYVGLVGSCNVITGVGENTNFRLFLNEVFSSSFNLPPDAEVAVTVLRDSDIENAVIGTD